MKSITPLPEPLVRLAMLAACLAALTLTGMGQAQPNYSVVIPKSPHGLPTKNASMMPAGQSSSTNNGILYHGGPVLNKPSGTNVYYIWYGDWSSNPGAKQILTDLVNHLGGSPYFNINTTYYDFDKESERNPVLNKVNFVASVDDHYSMGANLSDLDVAYVVGNSIGLLGPGAPFPPDTNGVFFCTDFAGCH